MARTKRLPTKTFQVSYQDMDHIFCHQYAKIARKTLKKILKMHKIKPRKNREKSVGALMEFYDKNRSKIPTYEELEKEIGINLECYYVSIITNPNRR